MRAVAVTILLLLASCGDGNTTSSDVSETQVTATAAPTTNALATTTTVGPTTTINPLFVWRADYSAMDTKWMDASNALGQSYRDDSFGGIPWERWPNWCTEQAVIDETFAAEITAYAWPAELQAMADGLSLALTVRAGIFHECSQLPGSFTGLSPISDRQDDAYEGLFKARIKLRNALGLPAQ